MVFGQQNRDTDKRRGFLHDCRHSFHAGHGEGKGFLLEFGEQSRSQFRNGHTNTAMILAIGVGEKRCTKFQGNGLVVQQFLAQCRRRVFI